MAVALLAAPPAVAAPALGLEGVQRFDHVVVLIEENESFATTWGTGSVAHYLNSLRARGVFADQYFATGHVSLDNYIEMVSGQGPQPLSNSDCLAVNFYTCVQPQGQVSGGRNLADQLETAGLSWKGYMDTMPSPCFHAPYDPTYTPPPGKSPDPYQGNSTAAPAKDYADRHNPFIYFPDIVENTARCTAHVLPYTALATDLAANRLPAFSFITPDTCHDGHDTPCSGGGPGGLTSADLWLTQEAPALLAYLTAHNGLLIITFDEGSNTDTSGCCTGGAGGQAGFGGRVGLLALGPTLKAGTTVSTAYDHASLLRTIEDSFGISEYLNNAGTATPMADVLAAAAGTTPGAGATPGPVALAGTGNTPLPGTGRGPAGPGLPAFGLTLVVAAALLGGLRRRQALTRG
ncbi:MAG TPA: alkaline phosphatase family protein [Candidatus Dormibacteraeota bacterium]|nr:alkaline phosphatase family protein [Candidatus Dormibacteraeota bacterium]